MEIKVIKKRKKDTLVSTRLPIVREHFKGKYTVTPFLSEVIYVEKRWPLPFFAKIYMAIDSDKIRCKDTHTNEAVILAEKLGIETVDENL